MVVGKISEFNICGENVNTSALETLDDKTFKAFCDLLVQPQLVGEINVPFCTFVTLNDERFADLYSALIQSNYLLYIGDSLFAHEWERLSQSRFENVSILLEKSRGNGLQYVEFPSFICSELNENPRTDNRFEMFCRLLTQCEGLSQIVFSSRKIWKLNDREFQILCATLSHCRGFSRVKFIGNHLRELGGMRFQALCAALAYSSKIEHVDSGHNCLSVLDVDELQAFGRALAKFEKLKYLDLSSILSNSLDAVHFASFGNQLGRLHELSSINLSFCPDHKFVNFAGLTILINHLSKDNLKEINLEDVRLNAGFREFEMFCNALKRCFRLKTLRYSDTHVNEKNRAILNNIVLKSERLCCVQSAIFLQEKIGAVELVEKIFQHVTDSEKLAESIVSMAMNIKYKRALIEAEKMEMQKQALIKNRHQDPVAQQAYDKCFGLSLYQLHQKEKSNFLVGQNFMSIIPERQLPFCLFEKSVSDEEFLIRNRHQHENLQHTYDKRFGLSVIK